MVGDGDFLAATMPALDRVYNLARRLTRHGPDAEDLVQETYLRAWQGWCAGRRPRQVDAWMATICLNPARDAARATGPHADPRRRCRRRHRPGRRGTPVA